MFIVPKSGLKIRDPNTLQIVPPEGREVDTDSAFWHRLVNDGDVAIVAKSDPAPAEGETK